MKFIHIHKSQLMMLYLGIIILLSLALFIRSQTRPTEPVYYPHLNDHYFATQTHTPVHRVTVIKRFPHRNTIYTQGIVWDNDHNILYESGGRYGHSSLSMITNDQQHILMTRTLASQYFAEDITLLENTLYLLTYRSNLGMLFDKNSLDLLGTFPLTTEGWGLTTDGTTLIISDGSDRLQFKDPQTFQTIKTLTVHDRQHPVSHINALQYVNGKIYANIWKTCFIAEISSASGDVLSWIDLQPLCHEIQMIDTRAAELNGIAWLPNSQHFLVTGKYWPTLYEIAFMVNLQSLPTAR